MEKTRIILAGAGTWGTNLLRNFVLSGRAEIVGIADPSKEACDRALKWAPGAKPFASLPEALEKLKPAAVAIASPPALHAEMALSSLGSGAHVLVEKPLCSSSKECETVLDEAKRQGKILFVDHTYAYHPAVTYLAEEAKSGRLGDLLYFDSVRANFGKFQKTNVLWDLGPHDLSILDLVTGGRVPESVSCAGAAHVGNVEDLCYVTLRYPGKFLAQLHLSWISPVKSRLIRIGGSKKMALFDDNLPAERVKLYDREVKLLGETDEQLRVGYRSGDMTAPALSDREPLSEAISHFLDCVEGKKKPLTDGESGLRVVKILEAADKSLRSKGLPIQLGH